LRAAVEQCRVLRSLPPAEPSFGPLAEDLAGELHGFDEAISMVMAHVRPEFFARGLRPYFDDIEVAGRTYLGPAAAHVPLFLVDLAVWASDHAGPQYVAFLDESREHTLPEWRAPSLHWRRPPAPVTHTPPA